MQSIILSKWSLFTMTVVVIVLFLIIVFSTSTTLPVSVSVQQASSQTARNPIEDKLVDKRIEFVESTTSPEQAKPEFPIHLEIPRINVSATIESVDLTPEGVMDIPKNPVDVAWFKPSPRPGENGSTVIAGHYGWKNGIPAVFDNLHKLVKGDKIYIGDEKGTVITFVVRELLTYGENDNASNVFTSSDGKSHLNLVTCKGVWNKTEKSYSKRLVVFADKE